MILPVRDATTSTHHLGSYISGNGS